ncbi:hypothetical protein N5079_19765 [Planotetraspora sp. A-T 1434]|uniref:hypothetical protein n=1 Tax=Planotetraspora sp. A-T 1434 TaxID=2979219 RepID=UPI0021C09C9E|nr:hypothetical protein [Planotetraspora sp. A-T 1434]MCT9932442.1 hypothetical protein [Planotetraspora sp. A-T 1434]
MAEIKRCKTAFATEHNGITRVIAAGELVSTDDPVYSDATAEHFEDIEVHVDEQAGRRAAAEGRPVEQATAEPGEKRTVRATGRASGAKTQPKADEK